MLIMLGSTILQPVIGKLLSLSSHGGPLKAGDFQLAFNLLIMSFLAAAALTGLVRLPERQVENE
jgi:hypothetical protein